MVEFMERVARPAGGAGGGEELSVEERNLLSVAYKNVISARARSPRRRPRPISSPLPLVSPFTVKMSRGGSAGGGQSQLGYLFGSGEAPKPAVAPAAPAASAPPAEKPAPAKLDVTKQIPAGVAIQTNNYHRADGQNTGNFLTFSGGPVPRGRARGGYRSRRAQWRGRSMPPKLHPYRVSVQEENTVARQQP